MTRLKFLLILLCLFTLSFLTAQQFPLFAQHPEHHGSINSASINSDFLTNEQTVSIGVSINQWANLGYGTPSTKVVRGEAFSPKNHILWGGYITDDHVGISHNTGIYARFAYIIPLWGEDLRQGGLSIGINGGIVQDRLRIDKIEWTGSPILNVTQLPFQYFDVGAGLYLYRNIKSNKSHYVYAGLSVPRTFDFGNSDDNTRICPHYYGLLGYYFPINNGYGELSSWTRYVKGNALQTSLNMKWQIGKLFLLGLGIVVSKSNSFFEWEVGYCIPANVLNKSRPIKIGFGYIPNRSAKEFFADIWEVNLAFVFDNR